MFRNFIGLGVLVLGASGMPVAADMRPHHGGSTAGQGRFSRSWSDLLVRNGDKPRRFGYHAPRPGQPQNDENNDSNDSSVGSVPSGPSSTPGYLGDTGAETEGPETPGMEVPDYSNPANTAAVTDDQTRPVPVPGAALLGAIGLLMASRIRTAR